MDKLAEKMAELAEKFGPSVVDAARGAVRIEAYSSMMAGFIADMICIAMTIGARSLWKYQASYIYNEGIPQFFGGLLFAGAGVAACVGIWSFINPWVWVAINNPDLYLAKKIFHL